jgi:hypothetical protein
VIANATGSPRNHFKATKPSARFRFHLGEL